MLKRNPLPSRDILLSRISYDPESGELTWKIIEGDSLLARQWNAQFAGKEAGSKSRLYCSVNISGVSYQASRLIWRMMTGDDPGQLDIDHRDTDRFNNRWSNLRIATRSQNCANATLRSDNIHRLKGVSRAPSGGYQARISFNKRTRSLGVFKTPELAHEAYQKAASENYGQFARSG